MKVFKTEDLNNNTEFYLKMQYFLTAIGLLMPVSIPVFILISIIKISLKKAILLSLFFSLIILTLYYAFFIKKTFTPKTTSEYNPNKVIVIMAFPIIFYSLIFLFSYGIATVAEILFLYSFLLTFIQNRNDFLKNFYIPLKNAINRSGTILSVVFLISIINFFHVYSHSTVNIFNFMLTNLTNSAYSLVFIYIIAFFLSIILDPLGILLVLSPIYESIIDVYGINPYSFLLSFVFFLTIGLSNNIVGLPGNIYREKVGFNTYKINEILIFEHLTIIILAFIPLIYGIFK
jgi:TRAP-type C4-dicarboxylate transport system permease large subunit